MYSSPPAIPHTTSDSREFKHKVKASVSTSFYPSSIKNRKPHPNKQTKKPENHICSTKHSRCNACWPCCNCSVPLLMPQQRLTCSRAKIPLSGTSTFCESQCTLGGEHRALGCRLNKQTHTKHKQNPPSSNKPGHQDECELKPGLWQMKLKASPALEKFQIGKGCYINSMKLRDKRQCTRFEGRGD